jgi:hypothetical protein
VEGRIYWRVTHAKGVRAFILTHEDEATKNLFEMANRYHEHCPELVRPQDGCGERERVELRPARLRLQGRHGEDEGNGALEHAAVLPRLRGGALGERGRARRWVMQAVPDLPGTEMYLESTGNGPGNFFHRTWQQAEAGESDFVPVFIPWFWQDEYRRAPDADFAPTPEEAALKAFFGLDDAQLAWRRGKIAELGSEMLFKQEYPCTAAEAFQFSGSESYIPAELILKARKANVMPAGQLVSAWTRRGSATTGRRLLSGARAR